MKIIFVFLLIISSIFANEYPMTSINLKKQDVQNRYALGLMYYFGEGKEQNIQKAKEIYQPLNDSSSKFLQIYSQELKSLIDNNIIPDENTVLNAFKSAFKKYKISNNLNEWEIKSINEFIISWNNEKQKIKFSPDKKTKIFSYPSSIIEEAGDRFIRRDLIKIENSNQSISFLDEVFDDTYLEEFDFIDNNKILISLTNLSYSNTYLIDINTFIAKLISSGLEYKINQINNKSIITIGTWGYRTQGGRVYYNKSYDENGNKIEIPQLNNFLMEWSYMLNSKNMNNLKNVYSNSVLYYNEKNLSKNSVIKDKERLLKKYPNFNQKTKFFSIEHLSENEYKIYYSKDVIYGKKSETFYSYLVVELINDEIFIKEENDNTEY